MTEIDWDRLQPLRMSSGSHSKGSGFGCAMNVVSYITGEATITDFPECADHRLARMVQMVNDLVANTCGERQTIKSPATLYLGDQSSQLTTITHVLSPEDAVELIRLGTKTIGTADSDVDIHQIVTKAMSEFKILTPPYINLGYPMLTSLAVAIWTNSLSGKAELFRYADFVLDEFRKAAGLDAVVEVPALEGILL